MAWNSPTGKAGRVISELLSRSPLDIACLCEVRGCFLPEACHGLLSEADYGYPVIDGRRKVTLWSKSPWRDATNHLPGAPPGRFVAGETQAPIGRLRMIGVCVPWEAAHVSTGARNRARWEDHITFLNALLDYLDGQDTAMPTLLLGDFNQTIPPKRAPQEARELLLRLLSHSTPLPPTAPEKRSVCHILASADVHAVAAVELPERHDGTRLSDHHGQVSVIVKR